MFSNDQQLREEDAELFFYSDVAWTRKHVRAAADLVRDLQGHGYFQTSTDSLIDASATATVTLEFEAIGGVLTVPAGTLVTVEDRSQAGYSNGVVGYVTDDELVVADGMTGTVTATASAEGDVFNVAADTLVHCGSSLANLGGVRNPSAGTGGHDHQLARAAVYRALELIHADLMRNEDDAHDAKRRYFRQAYKDELTRLVASGVAIDRDGDGVGEKALKHGFHRFERG